MILRLAVAVSVATALMTAFLFVRSTDEVAPRGTTQLVTVWDVGTMVTRSEARAVIARSAPDYDLTLYKSVVAADAEGSRRTLYAMNADARSANVAGNPLYADVGRSYTTRFAPGRDLPLARVGGLYVTDGSASDAVAFVRALDRYGIDAEVRPFTVIEALSWSSRSFPLPILMATASLGLLAGCVHTAVARRRTNAILIAGGASRRSVIVSLVAAVLRCIGGAALIGSAVGTLALWVYNDLAQFDRIAATAAFGVAAVAVAAVVVTAVALVIEGVMPLPTALGRRQPLRQLAVFDVGIHCLALTLTLVSVSSVLSTGSDVASNRRDAASWKAAVNVASVEFTANDQEYDSIEGNFARIADRALRRGDALVSSHPAPPTSGHGPDHGDSLIVNDAYLAAQAVVDHRGRRILSSRLDPHALTLMIPDTLRSRDRALVDEYSDWAAFQLETDDGGGGSTPEVPIDVVHLRTGQNVFTYSTIDSTSSQRDPVIAVLPTARRLVSDNWIVANATTGGVLFTDGARLQSEIEDGGLSDYIGSIAHGADDAAIRLGDQERIFGAQIFGSGLAALISIMSCAILARALAERHRRSDFVLVVHGSHPGSGIRAPALFLCLSGVIALAASTVTSSSLATDGLACLVAAVNVASACVMIAVFRLRFFAESRDRA